MNGFIAVGLIFVFILANIPFISNTFFFNLFRSKQPVNWLLRLIQWFFYMVVSLLIMLGIEYYLTGQNHPQAWEFYYTNLFLFTIFAFPGFIWQLYCHQPK